MLQSQVKSAIKRAKLAIDDLAYDSFLVKRTASTYVPGQSISYTEVKTTVKVVIWNYDHREVDLQNIQVNDAKLIIFNESQSDIPEPNDTIVVRNIVYRVIKNQPIYAGSEIVLCIVQARPLS